jgi:non-ribosomal peptide synthetase component E (peptide arylation enzyme)
VALLRAARACGVSDFAAARRIQCVGELPQLANGKTDYVALNAFLADTAPLGAP